MPSPHARMPDLGVTSSNFPPPTLRKRRPHSVVFGLPQRGVEFVT
jgi:hypothetical protein